jgi:hypothetical protein
MLTEQGYVDRAIAAYHRESAHTLLSFPQPGRADSETRTYQDKDYVVLANSYDVLAVYRIKPSGQLRRLKRWPAGLTPEEA